MGIRFFSITAPMLLVAAADTAAAQDFTAEVAKCAAMTDSGERLACYDAVAHRLAPKPELGREQLPKPETQATVEALESLTAAVSEASLTPAGRLVLVLENGQVWQQLDGDVARFPAHNKLEHTQVTISRGSFGSYNLQFAGQNALYKVRRVK